MNRIKAYRLAHGVKSKYVAEQLGITPENYSRWEANEDRLKPYQVKAVCCILKCDPSDIFFPSEDSNANQ